MTAGEISLNRRRHRLALALAFASIGIWAAGGARAQQGAPVLGPENAATPASYGSRGTFGPRPWVACGPERCLALWEGDLKMWASVLDASLKPLQKAAFPVGGYNDVGGTPVLWSGSDFILVGVDRDGATTLRVTTDGVAGAPVRIVARPASGVVSRPALAKNGGRILVAWRETARAFDMGPRIVRCLLLDETLAVIAAPITLGQEMGEPRPLWVVSGGDGFVVISNGSVYGVGPDGALRAGPVTFPGSDGVSAVVATGADPVVAFIGAAGIAGGLVRLGPALTPVLMAPGAFSALGWNGTHILATRESGFLRGPPAMIRFTPDLVRADAMTPMLPLDDVVATALAGRGEDFALIYKFDRGFAAADNGTYSLPLNAGGRPRATEGTLISVTALPHTRPAVKPTADGFVAAVHAGLFKVEIAGLDSDGRPRAGRPLTSLDASAFQLALASGPEQAFALWFPWDTPVTDWLGTRIGRAGDRLDEPSLVLPYYGFSRQGVWAAWNGRAYLVAGEGKGAQRAILVQPVRPDGALEMQVAVPINAGAAGLAVGALGTTTLLAWADINMIAATNPPLWRSRLTTVRLDDSGRPLDTAPATVGDPWTTDPRALSPMVVAHDGLRFLVVWEAPTVAATRAVTSTLLAARVGMDGRALDAAPVMLRTATGAAPTTMGTDPGESPLSSLSAAFDGAMYWIVWKEAGQGTFTRRLATDGRAIDPQPLRLMDEVAGEPQIASHGDRRVLLIYTRLDNAVDMQAPRLKSRMISVMGAAGVDGGADPVDGNADGGANGPDVAIDLPAGAPDATLDLDSSAPADTQASDSPPAVIDASADGGADSVDDVGGPNGSGGSKTGTGGGPGGRSGSSSGSSGCGCAISDCHAGPGRVVWTWVVMLVAVGFHRRRARRLTASVVPPDEGRRGRDRWR